LLGTSTTKVEVSVPCSPLGESFVHIAAIDTERDSFGLSYTTFGFSDFAVNSAPVAFSEDTSSPVSVKVTNTGSVAGAEVVQVYVSIPSNNLSNPKLQLRAFGKTGLLQPGSSETIHLSLDKYAFAYWDEGISGWKVSPGKYEISVGNSSDNIIAQAIIQLSSGGVWKGL